MYRESGLCAMRQRTGPLSRVECCQLPLQVLMFKTVTIASATCDLKYFYQSVSDQQVPGDFQAPHLLVPVKAPALHSPLFF